MDDEYNGDSNGKQNQEEVEPETIKTDSFSDQLCCRCSNRPRRVVMELRRESESLQQFSTFSVSTFTRATINYTVKELCQTISSSHHLIRRQRLWYTVSLPHVLHTYLHTYARHSIGQQICYFPDIFKQYDRCYWFVYFLKLL